MKKQKTCTSNNPILGGTYKLTITKETIQADRYKNLWNPNVEITEKTRVVKIISGEKGALQPGDVVGIGETEDFFVLSSDNSPNGKTILLAKYNLMVGQYYDEDLDSYEDYSTSNPAYGLQSEEVYGYDSNGISSGAVTFSNTNYWMNGNTLKSKYSQNGTIYYDENENWEEKFKYVADNSVAHPYVYDENSNLYQYINGENGYVNRLIEMGAPGTITGRLLTYEEAVNAVNVENDGNSIILNKHHNYWIGTAVSDEFINDYETFDQVVGAHNYYMDDYFGVRPVIEILTSEID